MSQSDNPQDQRLEEFEDEAGDHPGGPAYVEQEKRVEEAVESGEIALDGTPVDQLQQERHDRLDPENRPDGAQVDNTPREFDVEKGMFTDNPEYDQAEKKFPPLGEGGA
ncbi:MAG TPA: hypothetical protein VD859_14945 [Nocardioides sp.]|nr:hypothetical protein [Nocardioides sp.]